MKKTLLIMVAFVLVLGISFQSFVGAQQAPRSFSIEMDFEPSASLEGVYDCRVKVDRGGELLAAPRVQIETGSEGQTRSSNPKTGEVVDLTVVSDLESGSLTYTVEIRSSGGLLESRHQARIRL